MNRSAAVAVACAAALGTASAGVSLYWAAGGSFLLDTVGGTLEDTARDGGTIAIAGGAALAELVAVGLALALPARTPRAVGVARRRAAADGVRRGAHRRGALALAGVFGEVPAENLGALRWHALFWDPWFAAWGVAWLLAWRGTARPQGASGTSRTNRRCQGVSTAPAR